MAIFLFFALNSSIVLIDDYYVVSETETGSDFLNRIRQVGGIESAINKFESWLGSLFLPVMILIGSVAVILLFWFFFPLINNLRGKIGGKK